MSAYRIVQDIADFGELWYFPEYFKHPYFFGLLGGYWERFREWKGCDPLGFDYGYGNVYFKDKEDAKAFLNKRHFKPKVIEYEKNNWELNNNL